MIGTLEHAKELVIAKGYCDRMGSCDRSICPFFGKNTLSSFCRVPEAYKKAKRYIQSIKLKELAAL
jgi:hypothetical protein